MNIASPRPFEQAVADQIKDRTADACQCLRVMVDADASRYDRARDLLKAIALFPEQLADTSREGTKYILAKLLNQARALRDLGLRSHWTYDLNVHIAVLAAIKAEQKNLERAP